MGDTAAITKGLQLLFDRPGESLITPKGDDKSLFVLSSEQYLPPDYESNGLELNNRFGDESTDQIPLTQLNNVPDFQLASQLPQDSHFSLFLPRHQAMAAEVINALMNVPDNQLQDFLNSCAYARAKLNPQLFNYAFSVALSHRRDTRHIPLTNHAELFPSKFMNSQVFQQARESTTVLQRDERIPIIIPRDNTATDLEEEHRLAYFREDIGVNLHHYHWHLVYPANAQREIVNKDRRGELFFYMHQQIVARYNGERLNNQLKRVKKFSNWREPIPEAYFPKLDSLTTARGWPPRQAGMTWQDMNREADGLRITISELEGHRRNLEEAVATGSAMLPDRSRVPLTIDILGNMVEASILSPNPQLYGNVHNNGHNFSAYVHDPEHRYLESSGVIADEATTMRDPFFYRWHAFIDDLFQKFKESAYVSPYSRSELEYQGVQVQGVRVENLEGMGQPNTLNTFWMQSDVDLSRGLDFSDRGSVYARFTHLNHRRFRYMINVNNAGSAQRATVRIFLAPKFDERNLIWTLTDQRKMFIEMDKFVVSLNSGSNTITRDSTESSVTIPFEQTFRDLSVQGNDPRRQNLASFNYCGCGWPQHMLVPKGTEGGAVYQLFVMLSNYDLDRVQQDGGSTDMACKEAFSYCGLKDKLYPDRRSMGFPFDRPAASAVNITDMILPNMALQEITVRFNNQTERNPRNAVQ